MASDETGPSDDVRAIAREPWEPMELRYLGNVGEIVQVGGDRSDRHHHHRRSGAPGH